MGITRSLLTNNYGNLPLPFLVVIHHLFSWIIFNNYCVRILTGSPRLKKFMIVYFILKTRGTNNSPNYFNIMVNYHYHGENRLTIQYFPSMVIIGSIVLCTPSNSATQFMTLRYIFMAHLRYCI